MMTENFIVRYKGGSAPTYQTVGAAGCDLMSAVDQMIDPQSWGVVSTGLFLEIPQGYEAQVRSRSGLALRHGVFVMNSPGTIDCDFRGEIKVILANMGHHPFIVKKGDRIAQMVFSPVFQATFEMAESLTETARGTGGFGSTGL
jgi:dUTP pyrophosphatase